MTALNNSRGKKIVMVIAPQDFRDEEYFIPKGIFEAAGFDIKTASLSRGEAIGVFGGVVKVDLALDEIEAADFAAVVFVGGEGMAKLIDDNDLHKLANAAAKQGAVIGAICIAPAVLAKAGVLKGKRATVWADENDQSAVEILRDNGIQYMPEPIVVDDKVITARDVNASRKFAEEMVKTIDRGL